MSFIQPFLDHILNPICNHNLDLYFNIINWISFLIQKSGNKTEISLVIIGEQGTDKNKFFSKLFERSLISNENNISSIIHRFNSSIENKILNGLQRA
jgi:septin family protein